jgi:hypothetical protein
LVSATPVVQQVVVAMRANVCIIPVQQQTAVLGLVIKRMLAHSA